MTRRYCDVCEKEISRSVVSQRYRPVLYRAGRNWGVEIIVRQGDTWNRGDLCVDCLKEIVSEGREYPRQTPPLNVDAAFGLSA